MYSIEALLIVSAAAAVALVSLIGALVFYVSEIRLKKWMPSLIAVAVGVLLGDAFSSSYSRCYREGARFGIGVALWVLIGIISFVFLESGLQWRHDHELKSPHGGEDDIASFAKMNLFGDGAHNFVDGVLITASFLADPALGVATTVAIVLHEIPQEISDVAVLIQGGFSRRKAVLLNFFVQQPALSGRLVRFSFPS